MPQEKAVVMDIGGIGNKILSTVDKHAMLIGGGMSLLQVHSLIQDSISRALGGNIHMPDLMQALRYWQGSKTLHAAILGYIGGMLLQEAGSGSIKRIGSVMQKAATGYIVVDVAHTLLYVSTHSPSPINAGPNLRIYG